MVLPDLRDGERRLRATWHPGTRTVVLSHWSGHVCTASARLALTDAAKLVGLVVSALQDTAAEACAAEAPAVPRAKPDGQASFAGYLARMGSVYRAGRAEVVKLGERAAQAARNALYIKRAG